MIRVVCWFSCGAASAVATKMVLSAPSKPFGADEVVIAYCEVKQEHPDNMRFLRDCEQWFGQEILVLGNDAFGRDTDRVFRETKYLVGPGGARCTSELKKSVRWGFQRPDDVVVLGFTAEEYATRMTRLRERERTADAVLADTARTRPAERRLLGDGVRSRHRPAGHV
jgi:hypothetical protein